MHRRRRSPILSLTAVLLGASACRNPVAPGERVRIVEVAAARAPCVGLVPTECLQVRTPPDTAWRLFHGSVEGFVHEAGYTYVLRVAERDVRNPPADGSSLAYRLLAVVSKASATQ